MVHNLDPQVLTEVRDPLRWETIAASATPHYPGAGKEILRRERDGMTITGVVTETEIATALPILESMPRIQTGFGSLLGLSLGAIGPDEPDLSRYYDDTDLARSQYEAAFGFEIHDRIASVLSPLFDHLPLVAPREGDRRYNPAQIRWWDPGMGGLPAHVGNEFRRELEGHAMRHLVSTTQVTNHLSYFMVLQRPETGGALSVYDLLWEDYDADGVPWDNCQRDDAEFDVVTRTSIDPNPGDLVVFGGGWRWHRVDPPGGARGRISYGGFCAPSIDGREIHFWT